MIEADPISTITHTAGNDTEIISALVFRIICVVVSRLMHELVFNSPYPYNEDHLKISGKVEMSVGSYYFRVFSSALIAYYEVSYIAYSHGPFYLLDMVGLYVCLIAVIWIVWCWISLGKYGTESIGVFRQHALVVIGPYNYMVHPIVFGKLVFIIGLYIFFGCGWMTIFLTLTMMFFRYYNLMRIEEGLLRRTFRAEYDIYMDQRYWLIPLIY